MKNLFVLSLMILFFSCQKKKVVENDLSQEYIPVSYDTTAIDSFSEGAISVDVADQIRRSTIAYQDSLRKAKIQEEMERKAREEEETKKAAEENKKKTEEAKKKATENSKTSN